MQRRLGRLERRIAGQRRLMPEQRAGLDAWWGRLEANLEALVLACPDDLQDAADDDLSASLQVYADGHLGSGGHGLLHWALHLCEDGGWPAPPAIPHEVVRAYLDAPSRSCHCECASCGVRLPADARGRPVFAACTFCGGGPVGVAVWRRAAHRALSGLAVAGLVDYADCGVPANTVLLAHGFRPGEQTLAQWQDRVRQGMATVDRDTPAGGIDG